MRQLRKLLLRIEEELERVARQAVNVAEHQRQLGERLAYVAGMTQELRAWTARRPGKVRPATETSAGTEEGTD